VPSISLDHSQALRILKSACRLAASREYQPSSEFQRDIEAIVTGPHLTYRYVLVTALLAKATDHRVNPLSLQARAALNGAYDARSLCHKVIVPHEPDLMDNALGGSNEPYLNKPARFKQLSPRNAVRAGRDQRTLRQLCQLLSRVQNADQAVSALQDALSFALSKKRATKAEIQGAVDGLRGGRQSILTLIKRYNAKSIYGETAATTTGTLFWIMGLACGADWRVQVHPVNEAGSSSHEISDIDVYNGNTHIYTAEVKDKAFRVRDVVHALSKVRQAGLPCLHFIKGPRAVETDGSEQMLLAEAIRQGVELVVVDLNQMAETFIAFAPSDLTLSMFVEALTRFAEGARAKTDTFAHLKEVMESIQSDGGTS
jgi:SacI restriction endonuclease